MVRDQLLQILDSIAAPECAAAVALARRSAARFSPIVEGTVAAPAPLLAPSAATRARFLAIAQRFPDESWFMHLVRERARYFTVFATEQGAGRACFDSADAGPGAPPEVRDVVRAALDTCDVEFRTTADKLRRLLEDGAAVDIVAPCTDLAAPDDQPPAIAHQYARLAELARRFPGERWRRISITTDRSDVCVWANEQGVGRACLDVGPDARERARDAPPDRARLERILDSVTPVLPSVVARARRLLGDGAAITGGQLAIPTGELRMRYLLDMPALHVRRQQLRIAELATVHIGELWYATTVGDVIIFATEDDAGRACLETTPMTLADERIRGRKFQIWEYWVSHAQLHLRSAGPTNIDLEFVAVGYIGLPTIVDDLEPVPPTAEECAQAQQLVPWMPGLTPEQVFAFRSGDHRHLVVAGAVFVSETDLPMMQSVVVRAYD